MSRKDLKIKFKHDYANIEESVNCEIISALFKYCESLPNRPISLYIPACRISNYSQINPILIASLVQELLGINTIIPHNLDNINEDHGLKLVITSLTTIELLIETKIIGVLLDPVSLLKHDHISISIFVELLGEIATIIQENHVNYKPKNHVGESNCIKHVEQKSKIKIKGKDTKLVSNGLQLSNENIIFEKKLQSLLNEISDLKAILKDKKVQSPSKSIKNQNQNQNVDLITDKLCDKLLIKLKCYIDDQQIKNKDKENTQDDIIKEFKRDIASDKIIISEKPQQNVDILDDGNDSFTDEPGRDFDTDEISSIVDGFNNKLFK